MWPACMMQTIVAGNVFKSGMSREHIGAPYDQYYDQLSRYGGVADSAHH